jgi:hypothetical protein
VLLKGFTSRPSQTGCLSFGSLLTSKFLGRPLAFAIALEVVIQSPSFGTTLMSFFALRMEKTKGVLPMSKRLASRHKPNGSFKLTPTLRLVPSALRAAATA